MPQRILIVKTSSIGDIFQAFYVLPYLKGKGILIDWLVDQKHRELVKSHPLVDRVIVSYINDWCSFKLSSFSPFLKGVRKTNYDAVFDLQGNWKSSFLLFFVKGKKKVGFGKDCVREKINLLFTNTTFSIPKTHNIRLFYLSLFQKFYQDPLPQKPQASAFLKLSSEESLLFLEKKSSFSKIEVKKVLVSMGSFWQNKRPSSAFILAFLKKIEENIECYFFFSWGNSQEKQQAAELAAQLKQAELLEKMSFPLWQHIVRRMDFLLATDSCFLSLCQETNIPSFSFFGPTNPSVFAPLGNHFFSKGRCPYGIKFNKQCPRLRTCKTGACIKELPVDESFTQFWKWYECVFSISQENKDKNSLPL